MPLFVCDRCLSVDNTALGGNYWSRLARRGGDQNRLCEACYTGTWHGKFPQRKFDPATEHPDSLKSMVLYGYIPAQFHEHPNVIQARNQP